MRIGRCALEADVHWWQMCIGGRCASHTRCECKDMFGTSVCNESLSVAQCFHVTHCALFVSPVHGIQSALNVTQPLASYGCADHFVRYNVVCASWCAAWFICHCDHAVIGMTRALMSTKCYPARVQIDTCIVARVAHKRFIIPDA